MPDMREFATPVTRDLDSRGIPYNVYHHPGPVQSLEQAARERGQLPEQIIRSILFRSTDDDFIMVLVSGPDQISWPDLRRYLGVSRITMATQTEVVDKTGYLPGSVSPFGLQSALRILVDQRVFEQEILSIGSGQRNSALILHGKDLRRALGDVEVGCFVNCN